MSAERTIDAIIFDIGGVIHPTPFEVMADVEARNGWPAGILPRGPWDPEGDPDYREVELAQIGERAYWARHVERLATAGIDFDVHEQMRFDTEDRIEVIDAIRILRGRYKLGILTNDATQWVGPGWHRDWWLRGLFGAIVDAYEVGALKPQPPGYVAAAEALGVPPDRCAFIDDLEANVAGAEAVGMLGVWWDVKDATRSTLEVLRRFAPDAVETSVAGMYVAAGVRPRVGHRRGHARLSASA